MLHVPQSCRLRAIASVARWNRLAAGLDEHALAEEGRSKLLLALVPGGTGVGDDVSKRIELWERSEFEALLQRCEQQKLLSQKHKKRKRQPQRDDPAGRRDRARRTAAAGACRKATSGLVSSMVESEDRQWASKLILNSDLSSGICVPPNHVLEVRNAGNGFDRPFAGLR